MSTYELLDQLPGATTYGAAAAIALDADNDRPGGDSAGANTRLRGATSRDHDIGKGAVEDGRPCLTANAPALDEEGLPNDETTIAQDALGAREDGSQG
jgi:hypothetical protein